MFNLVRVKLFFKGLSNFVFPKNYDDIFSSVLVEKINSFSEIETKYIGFDLFTFSNFVIENFNEYNGYFISLDGVLSIVISSISEDFLRILVSYLVDGNPILFENNQLYLVRVEFLENIEFKSNESNFISISPILLKNFPDDADIFSFLENLLINNYCRYYNLNFTTVFCEISTHKEIFQEFIDNDTNSMFNNHYYMLDLYIKGDSSLISFAYDVGLGHNTNFGFGMLELY